MKAFQGPSGGATSAVLLLFILLTSPAAGQWPQYGSDPARSGAIAGQAPSWNDIAFSEQLELEPGAEVGWPIVVDREAFVAAATVYMNVLDPTAPITGRSVIYGIHLDTAAVRVVARPDLAIQQLASDGTALFGAGHRSVVSIAIADGATLWTGTVGLPAAEELEGTHNRPPLCSAPAVSDGAVFVACSEADGGQAVVAVDAFDHSDGRRLWPQAFVTRTAPPVMPCEASPNDPQCVSDIAVAALSSNPFVLLTRPPLISVVQDHVLVAQSFLGTTEGGPSTATEARYGGYGIFAVSRDGTNGRLIEQSANYGTPTVGSYSPSSVAAPTGDERWVFTKGKTIDRYDATELRLGARKASYDLWGPGLPDHGSGLAYTGEHVYATSKSTLTRFTTDLQPESRFEPYSLSEGQTWAEGPILAYDGVVVARSEPHSASLGPSALHAVDAITGALVWSHAFHEAVLVVAEDGALVAVGESGLLTVLGSTAGAISPSVSPNTYFPAVGDAVIVDVSGQGVFGAATSFSADWGDGAVTDWQNASRLVHRYSANQDAAARFYLRNDHNQTASFPMTFHVGQKDPSVNILNSPFSNQYQETTFFLLGLLLTGLVALIGIYRAGRKRRRLGRDLRELETDYTALKDDPARCEGMLAQRRARARALFLERKLEEAHASFLVTRVDELRHGLRINEVEQRLDFLPLGMVKALREILRDSKITQWERGQFIAALERDTFMSAQQKAKVQDLIETWFASDVALKA